jgi:hypothetical protein
MNQVFKKQTIQSVLGTVSNVVNQIDSFGGELESAMDDVNFNFNLQIEQTDKLFNDISSRINQNDFFSEKVKGRLIRELDKIHDDLNSENFELDLDLDDSDVLDNFSTDGFKLLEEKTYLEEHLTFINNKIEEVSDRAEKINQLCKYKKPIHKFVIEKRNGIIAIKDKNHPQYLFNKNLPISINNDEVIFCKDGVHTESGWFIPDSIINEFKTIKRKLNKLLNS